MTTTLTYGSLFSGVGGFDMGLDQAGFHCVFQVEWDKHCQQVLNRHWPNVPKWSDVQDVNGAEVPPCDVLIFGSLCQDLSVAGKRAGIDGGRSSMFYEAIRIIKEMRSATGNTYPRVVVWENVPGALSSNKGADFQTVLDKMGDCGSHLIEWAVLDAQHFGVPQRRRRIFLVAVLDPTDASRCPDPLFPVASGSKRDHQQTGTAMCFYRTHGKQDTPRCGQLPPLKVVGNVALVSETQQPRNLTPLECERAMGWPDHHTRWTADGREQADSHRYKQCGNGVATPVARWVAEQIKPLMKEGQ